MRWWRKLLLKTALAASNVLFFGVAIGLLVQGARLRREGWLDVFEDDFPWFHTAYVLVVVLLSVLVASLAISGFYSVLFRRKQWVLVVYVATTLLTFAFCLFLSIEGAVSLSTAQSWKARAAVDAAVEGNVEANFDQVYCVSQAAYLCTASSRAQWLVHFGSDDLRDLYLAKDIAATIKQAMTAERSTSARSLLELCEDESSPLHDPVLTDDLADLCTWCGNIADLKSYVHLVSWANSKCPPSKLSAQFCIQSVWLNYTNPENIAPSIESPREIFATGQASGETLGESSSSPQERTAQDEDPSVQSPVSSPPYEVCRKTFLSYWSYLSAWFLVFSLLLLGFMVVVIRIAWVVLRPKPERYNSRHGNKPERKPLMQLSSQLPTSGATSSATRPPGSGVPTDNRPSAVDRARALLSPRGHTSP